jgi:hypothetical protein
MVWLGAPDQGAGSSPLRPLGRNGEEIELTHWSIKMKNETQLNESGRVAYEETLTGSHLTRCGVTQYPTSDLTFSNATVYMSRVASYDATQRLVASRTLARPQGLVFGILV